MPIGALDPNSGNPVPTPDGGGITGGVTGGVITGGKKPEALAPAIVLQDFIAWAESVLDPASPQLPLPTDGASLAGLSKISWFSGSSFVAFLEAFLSAMQMFMQLQSQEQKMEFKGMINTLVLGVVNSLVIKASMKDDIDEKKMQAITSAVSAGVSGAGLLKEVTAEAHIAGADKTEIDNLQGQKTKLEKEDTDLGDLDPPGAPPTVADAGKNLADTQAAWKTKKAQKEQIEEKIKNIDSRIYTATRNYTQQVKAMVEQLTQMMTQAMTALNAGYGAVKETDKQQWEGLKALLQSWIEVNKSATDSSHQSFQSASQEFDSMIQLLMKLSQWIAQWGGNKGSG